MNSEIAYKIMHGTIGLRWFETGSKNLEPDIISFVEEEATLNPCLESTYNLAYLNDYHYKDYDYAEELYNKVLELDPEHKDALINLAVFNHNHKDYEQAKQLYTKILKLNPDTNTHIYALMGLGQIHTKHKDYERAKELYDEALLLDPENPDIYLDLAELYIVAELYATKDPEKAIQLLNTLIELNPKNVKLLYAVASVYYYQLEDYECAKALYNKILELDPEHIEAVHSLASIYDDSKDYERAKQLYIRVLEINPERVEALKDLADLYYYDFKDYEIAKDLYTKILTLYPDMSERIDSLMMVGNALNLVDYENFLITSKNANFDLDSDLEMQSDTEIYIDTLNQLGKIYRDHHKDYINAEKMYNIAFLLNPENPDTLLELASLCVDREYDDTSIAHDDTAFALYDKILKIDPENTKALYNLGFLYESYEDDQELAKECYTKCVSLDPTDEAAFYRLGRLYEDSKDYERAKECYVKALELDPTYERARDSLSSLPVIT